MVIVHCALCVHMCVLSLRIMCIGVCGRACWLYASTCTNVRVSHPVFYEKNGLKRVLAVARSITDHARTHATLTIQPRHSPCMHTEQRHHMYTRRQPRRWATMPPENNDGGRADTRTCRRGSCCQRAREAVQQGGLPCLVEAAVVETAAVAAEAQPGRQRD